MGRADKVLSVALVSALAAIVLVATVRVTVDLTGPNVPAWIQSIGTIVAIAIGMLVANWQIRAANRLELDRRDREMRVERRRAKALAGRIASVLIDVELACTKAESVAAKIKVSFEKAPVPSQDQLHLILLGVRIPTDIYSDLWAMPEDGFMQISHTLYTVDQYDRTISEAMALARLTGATGIASLAAVAVDRLARLKAEIGKALPYLGPLVV